MKKYLRDILLIIRSLKKKAQKILQPVKTKERHELNYWLYKKRSEGELSNDHYLYFYTQHFGFDISFYNDKVILDIGCGPRGSLEWASTAKRRIGLDPLANEYLKLGADKHQMEYICSHSEKIPLRTNECDAVFSFNSLDHVVNVRRTINEIKRVIKPGGYFLLLVDVNHAPTDCEPHNISPKGLISQLKPEFICEDMRLYKPIRAGLYKTIAAGELFSDPLNPENVGCLSAKFVKR